MLVRTAALLAWLSAAQVQGQVDLYCGKGDCDPSGGKELGRECVCWPGTPDCDSGPSPTAAPTPPAETQDGALLSLTPTCPESDDQSSVSVSDYANYVCPGESYMCTRMADGQPMADGYFADPNVIGKIAEGVDHFLKCTIPGITEYGSDVVLDFTINDKVDQHDGADSEEVCLHMTMTGKIPEEGSTFLMSNVAFASLNQANIYSYSGVDSSVHYGTVMGTFCAPGALTHITMCVTPCAPGDFLPRPTAAPVEQTAFPTPAEKADGAIIDTMSCPTEGRGAMEATYIFDETLGDGGANDADTQCVSGSRCTVGGNGQEFAFDNDFANMVGTTVTVTCEIEGAVSIDVDVYVKDDANFIFTVTTEGYFISGGILKGGKRGNTIFSWPICGDNADCCNGTECEECADTAGNLWGGEAVAYGGRKEVAVGMPYSDENPKQQAMSHINLCIAPETVVCPDMGAC